MDGQYSLLNQIFGLGRTSAKAHELALLIGTQTAAQPIEQGAVRRRIAVQSRKHQSLSSTSVVVMPALVR